MPLVLSRLALLVGACLLFAPPASADPVFDVPADVETEAVQQEGDAADDAEIWRNAAHPEQSRIFATDKKRGFMVLDLAGKLIQFFELGRLNNVDLREDWTAGGDSRVLIGASDRTKLGITFFMLDPETLAVTHLAGSFIDAGLGDPYGLCFYRSRKDNALSAFVIGKDGEVRQFALAPSSAGEVEAKLVRSFAVGSIAEGCVADDRTGALYIAEETKGIWRYGAEPETGEARVMILPVDGKDIVEDIEGLTLAASGETGGYLVASIQGNSTFALISLPEGKLAHRFRIVEAPAVGIDAVTGTDGVAVATGDFGSHFPEGVLVAQDDENGGGTTQNFKIVSWASVLASLPTR
ncbi:MAG: phytase [Hyphomicrobium sp.]|uniref:phytase n=1 Tax=Hyphomicrobium sp. TaxID=82 RepID=UPI003D0B1E95